MSESFLTETRVVLHRIATLGINVKTLDSCRWLLENLEALQPIPDSFWHSGRYKVNRFQGHGENAMKKAPATFALTLIFVICRSMLGEDASSSKGEPDNPTPQVRIVEPADRAVISGSDVAVKIVTKDFQFAYDRATTPGTKTTLPAKYASVPQQANSGHVHVYLAPYPPGGSVTPTQFYMVTSFVMPDKAEFVLHDVKPGTYRLLVDLVNHDHTPRIKHHPRDWPPLDMVTITVQ